MGMYNKICILGIFRIILNNILYTFASEDNLSDVVFPNITDVENIEFWRNKLFFNSNRFINFKWYDEELLDSYNKYFCFYCNKQFRNYSFEKCDKTVEIDGKLYIDITEKICEDHKTYINGKCSYQFLHLACLIKSYLQIICLLERHIIIDVNSSKQICYKILRSVFGDLNTINIFFEILKIIVDVGKKTIFENKKFDNIGCLNIIDKTSIPLTWLIEYIASDRNLFIEENFMPLEEDQKKILETMAYKTNNEFIEMMNTYARTFKNIEKDVDKKLFSCLTKITTLSDKQDKRHIESSAIERLKLEYMYKPEIGEYIRKNYILCVFFDIRLERIEKSLKLSKHDPYHPFNICPMLKKILSHTNFDIEKNRKRWDIFTKFAREEPAALEEIKYFLNAEKWILFDQKCIQGRNQYIHEYMAAFNVIFGYIGYFFNLKELKFSNYNINICMQIINHLSQISPYLYKLMFLDFCSVGRFNDNYIELTIFENITDIYIEISPPYFEVNVINTLLYRFKNINRLSIILRIACFNEIEINKDAIFSKLEHGFYEIKKISQNDEINGAMINSFLKLFRYSKLLTIDMNGEKLSDLIYDENNEFKFSSLKILELRRTKFSTNDILYFLSIVDTLDILKINDCCIYDPTDEVLVNEKVNVNMLVFIDTNNQSFLNFRYILNCKTIKIDLNCFYNSLGEYIDTYNEFNFLEFIQEFILETVIVTISKIDEIEKNMIKNIWSKLKENNSSNIFRYIKFSFEDSTIYHEFLDFLDKNNIQLDHTESNINIIDYN